METDNGSETGTEGGFQQNQITHDGGRKTIIQYGVNHTEEDINDSLPDSDLASEDERQSQFERELDQRIEQR